MSRSMRFGIAKFCVGCLVLGILAVASQSAFAQGGPPGRGRGGFGGMFGNPAASGLMLLMNPKVQEELDLVDDQIEDLKGLQEEMQTEMRNMFSGMQGMDAEERRSAMEDMRSKMEKKVEEFQAEVDEVLLPHQRKRLKQLAFQSQNRMGGGFGGGRGGLSDAMKKELDITSEQEEKMQATAEKAQEEYQAEVRKLQTKMEDKILKELTDEQRKQYKEIMGEAFDFGQMFGRGGFGGGPGGGRGGQGGQGGNQGGRGGRSDF